MEKYIVLGKRGEIVYLSNVKNVGKYIMVAKEKFLFEPVTGDVTLRYISEIDESEAIYAYDGTKNELDDNAMFPSKKIINQE